MKFFIFCVLIGFVACDGASKTQGKYIWDLLKPALSAAEVQSLITTRGGSFPTYNIVPQTSFSCASKAQPGFYADTEAQCQAFHRCDQSLNQTSYLCVNSTVFNQLTLVCDAWYNVDCERSRDVENFANSRLYSDLPLFDTPPADYISPFQLILLQNQGVSEQVSTQATGQQVVSKPEKKRPKQSKN